MHDNDAPAAPAASLPASPQKLLVAMTAGAPTRQSGRATHLTTLCPLTP